MKRASDIDVMVPIIVELHMVDDATSAKMAADLNRHNLRCSDLFYSGVG
jgi:hypothetical protein